MSVIIPSGWVEVGSNTFEKCSSSVRIDGKDGSVTISHGEGKFIELSSKSSELNWYCGGNNHADRSSGGSDFTAVSIDFNDSGNNRRFEVKFWIKQ